MAVRAGDTSRAPSSRTEPLLKVSLSLEGSPGHIPELTTASEQASATISYGTAAAALTKVSQKGSYFQTQGDYLS